MGRFECLARGREDLVDQAAACVVGDEEGEGLPGKGFLL